MDEIINIKSTAYLRLLALYLALWFSFPLSAEVNQETVVEANYMPYYWLILFVLSFFIFLKIKKITLKSHPRLLLKSLYTRIEFNDDEDSISLYYSHQSKPHLKLRLVDITQSEIFLNDRLINTIDNTVNNRFNQNISNTMLNAFNAESRFKMVDKRVRKIHAIITCPHNKHTVCLYLREGNQRLTKDTYQGVVEFVNNWCWLIAMQVNPENTETPSTNMPAIEKESN